MGVELLVSRANNLWLRKDRTRTARYGKGLRWQIGERFPEAGSAE